MFIRLNNKNIYIFIFIYEVVSMNITNLSFFKARINDIEFNNEHDFNSVSFLL